MRLSKDEQAARKARYRSKHNYVEATQERAAAAAATTAAPRVARGAAGPDTPPEGGKPAAPLRSLVELERVLEGLDAPGDDKETEQQYRELVDGLKKQAEVKMAQYRKLMKDRKDCHHAYAALNSEIEEQMRAPVTPAPSARERPEGENEMEPELELTSSALVDADISAAEMVLPSLEPGAEAPPLRGAAGGQASDLKPDADNERSARIVWVRRYGEDATAAQAVAGAAPPTAGEDLAPTRLGLQGPSEEEDASAEDSAGERGDSPGRGVGDADDGAAQVVAEVAGRVYRLEAEVRQLHQEKAAMREEFEAFKTHMGKLFMKMNGSVLGGWPERPLTPNEGGTGADFAAFFHPAPELPPPVVQEPLLAAGAASDAGQAPRPPPEWLAVREPPPLPSSFRPRPHGALSSVTKAALLLEEDYTVPVYSGGS